MATRTANHTTPQGGGGTESRAKPRTTPHHTTGGAGLQADPNPEPHRTTGGVGGGKGYQPLGGGGGTAEPGSYVYVSIYIYILFFDFLSVYMYVYIDNCDSKMVFPGCGRQSPRRCTGLAEIPVHIGKYPRV